MLPQLQMYLYFRHCAVAVLLLTLEASLRRDRFHDQDYFLGLAK
jgi:hypothetical protein